MANETTIWIFSRNFSRENGLICSLMVNETTIWIFSRNFSRENGLICYLMANEMIDLNPFVKFLAWKQLNLFFNSERNDWFESPRKISRVKTA